MSKTGDDGKTLDEEGGRKGLLRTVVIFQFKLFVDGLRDVILVPVSIIAAALDLLSGVPSTSGNFASVMNMGRRSERYIDLFGERANRVPDAEAPDAEPGLDDLLGMVETRFKENYRKDDPAGSAQKALESLRQAVKDARHRADEGSGSTSHPDQ
jgi:hypothetical protein